MTQGRKNEFRWARVRGTKEGADTASNSGIILVRASSLETNKSLQGRDLLVWERRKKDSFDTKEGEYWGKNTTEEKGVVKRATGQ